jgi:DNA/RNA-binding protein KIN17
MGKDKKYSTKKIWNNLGKDRLAYYCTMCQKQCRDQQGFASHCDSESHHRQMEFYLQNEDSFKEKFSQEFTKEFMETLKRRFKNSKVLANDVYQLLTSDTHHTHLNSTKWTTLDEFVGFIGKEGVCRVENSQKGFLVQVIDREEEKIKKIEIEREREKLKLNDEERLLKTLEKQVQAAKELEKSNLTQEVEISNLNEENLQPLKIEINLKEDKVENEVISNVFLENEVKSNKRKREITTKLSNLNSIIQEEEKRKEKKNRRDYWLHKGIVVKVLSKIESKKYYKQKGVVLNVIDDYTGEIEMLDTKDVLRIDQSDLETVIPKIGNEVMIVNGAYREEFCVLESIDVDNFCADLKSKLLGQIIRKVPYEDFSKLSNS